MELVLFEITDQAINSQPLIATLRHDQAGALVTFEGWVRNHNDGKSVSSLEYQVYQELAVKEGLQIINEAKEKYSIHQAIAVHRSGHLQIGETAVWVGTIASHRQAAFQGAQYIIDQIKVRLPIWKKEHYLNHPAEWVYCRHHHGN
ncbi:MULTISPECIES: molybdenum cofactor biosynthesis protein MoaE [unclassified Synechocystis]|uniref:molybdenum cofactor biosynthesis protein MoaE n=1 Tax=unclassified Synechocystis TaxID=2640012 RepID=UPI0004234254|nr:MULTISPECIES: molybdenum cofactor biosynthesis protein MoaE [unclassified Synechocystis]AIE74574.1 Molybdenum cofactor biosynthesis protein MoaE [Synechocystis sp. PCC 6714]MCT0254062.1 molybdenum cofactor biosynthesis protein MoaE [Synechocystis sp. CS-94]